MTFLIANPVVFLLLVLGVISLGFHLAEKCRKQDYERGATPQPGVGRGPR